MTFQTWIFVISNKQWWARIKNWFSANSFGRHLSNVFTPSLEAIIGQTRIFTESSHIFFDLVPVDDVLVGSKLIRKNHKENVTIVVRKNSHILGFRVTCLIADFWTTLNTVYNFHARRRQYYFSLNPNTVELQKCWDQYFH